MKKPLATQERPAPYHLEKEGLTLYLPKALCIDLAQVTTHGRHFPMPELKVRRADAIGNLTSKDSSWVVKG